MGMRGNPTHPRIEYPDETAGHSAGVRRTRKIMIANCIVRNARVYTVNRSFDIADSFVIQDGRIADIGKDQEIGRRWRSEQEVDLGGACVYPGFIDPHSHLLSYGENLGTADLAGARSWEEVVDRLAVHQREHPSDWILGRGWDQNLWPDPVFPSKDLLDRTFPDTPVHIIRIDGHASIANSAALRLAGVDRTSSIDGGEVVMGEGGPTGVLIDNAIELVRKKIPAAGQQAKEQSLLLAQERCFSVGLTTVTDAGIDRDDALLMDALQQAGRLKLRIFAMLNPTEENFSSFVARGVHMTDRLTIRTLKTYADGALGSMGALLLKPYEGDPSNRGLQLESTERLREICRRAAAGGYQVSTHCIGDAGVRLMLDLYSEFLPSGNDWRWRIEHAQIVDPEDLPKFREHGIVPSVQTSHAISDMKWAPALLGDRIKYAYRYQDLLQQNGWLPNGSDFPIESINPILGFHAAVARTDRNGHPEGGFQMENALTREQALRAMTLWAARANFGETTRGSLEIGKWADFVVLDRDLMQVPAADIPSARVLRTFIAGEPVFSV